MKFVKNYILIIALSVLINPLNVSLAHAFFNFTPDENLSVTGSIKERTPSVTGNYVVWSVANTPTSSQIYLYDLPNKKKVLIVNNGYINTMPKVSGDLVVYQSLRSGQNGVYVCNYVSATQSCAETKISDKLFRVNSPYIKGTHVIWAEKKALEQPFELKHCEFNLISNQCSNPQTMATGLYENDRIIMLSDNDTVLWSGANVIYSAKVSDYPTFPKTYLLDSGKLSQSYNELAESNGRIVFNITDTELNQSTVKVCVLNTVPLACQTILTLPYVEKNLNLSISGDNIVYNDPVTRVDFPAIHMHSLKLGVTVVVPKETKNYMLYPSIEGDRIVMTEGGSSMTSDEICSMKFSEKIEFITNDSFEVGKDPWKGWSTNEMITNEEKKYGSYSAKLSMTSTKQRVITQTVGPILPFASYQASAFVKTFIIGSGQAYVEVQWRKAGGGLIRTDVFGYAGGTSDWSQKNSSILVAPAEAAKADVNLVAPEGSGAVYFDKVTFTKK